MNMKTLAIKLRPGIFIVTVIMFNLAAVQNTADIEIAHAKIRHTPPSMKVTAAYMTIHNHSMKNKTLVSLQTPVAEKAQVHESFTKDGMIRMEHRPEVPIPAHGKIELKPGGWHIMLMGLKRPLKIDELVPLTLIFKDSTRIITSARVADMRSSHKQHANPNQHLNHSTSQQKHDSGQHKDQATGLHQSHDSTHSSH